MIKILFRTLIIFTLLNFCLAYSLAKKDYNDGDMIIANINGRSLQLIVAISDQEKAKGLSNRKEIPYDGMIFLFEKPKNLAFWMKDMHFPIDIIWINNNKVIEVSENIKPEPNINEYNLKKYSPSQRANIVLELSAGKAKQLNIRNGSIIKLQPGKQNDRYKY
jgi:uncharacterized membrane protein (UPF0127 family)